MEPYHSGEATAFDLSGGHPALNFVNTLDNRFGPAGGTERLCDYRDLLRLTVQVRLLDSERADLLGASVGSAAADRALRAAKELREALARVLYGEMDGRAPHLEDLRVLERYFHEAGRHQALRWSKQPAQEDLARFTWTWLESDRSGQLPVFMLAAAASALIMSPEHERIRACDAPTCRWLFLDTSKNHSRRWCNMKVCGNRAKARTFQQRHRN